MPARFSVRSLASAPWGLLWAIVLIVLIEGRIARRRDVFLMNRELDWYTAGIDARRSSQDADILLFGDSMVKFGVAPKVLEPRLGRTIRNLALLNGRPGASYFLLRRALDAGAKPSIVLVDYQPECMIEERDHLLDNSEWKAFLTLPECWNLSLAYGDPGFFVRTAVAGFLPSVRCRLEVRKSVVSALGGTSNPTPLENAKVLRNRGVNHGGMILASKPGYQGDVIPKIMRGSANPKWHGREDHAVYIERFLDLANRRGIPVLWLVPPNVPTIERERERLGLDHRFEAFVQGFQKRYPNLVVVDGRGLKFDHTWFVDPVHLDRHGATALSEALSVTMRTILDDRVPSSRWVTLPPASRKDEQIALEDVDQSEVAIRSTTLRR